jgi:transcriptional antiterminator RfaH
MLNENEPFWGVVQTETCRERLAIDSLERAGFIVFCPRLKIKKLGRTTTPPLFPNYLFVKFFQQWWAARWALGVIRVCMAGDHPSKLDENIMQEIRKRQGPDGFIRLKPAPQLKYGERVRILGGRLDGQLALYAGQTSRQRIRVLMAILGQEAPVELGMGDKVELVAPVSS